VQILQQFSTILSARWGISHGIDTKCTCIGTDSSDTESCRGDGYDDGRNNPFSQGQYEICGDTYYDAFIEGCMSVGNTEEVCEQATDAGD
jgi:hypothetical protein